MNTGPYPPPGNDNQPPMYPGQYPPPPYSNPSYPQHNNSQTLPNNAYRPGLFQQPPYPPYTVPPQQRKRGLWLWYKRQTGFAKVGLGCGLIVGVLLLCTCSLTAIGSTLPPVPASSSPQTIATTARPTATPTLVPLNASTLTPTLVPTAIPTPVPTATPMPQGPDRKTVQDMLYQATYSESLKIDFYSQRNAVLRASDTLGTALCCDVAQGAAQEIIFRIEKAFYTSNVYISSVAVTIYGTIWKNGTSQGTGPIVKATLKRSTANTID
jgi:hypothetical protein